MNDRLKSLVKKIFIGATAALSTTSVSASSKTNNPPTVDNLSQNKLASQSNFEKESEYPKLILEKPSKFNLGSYLFPSSHTSHASHSSHASHASHVSGYSQPPAYQPKPVQNPNKINNESPNKKSNTQILFKLGSRILKKDMSGTDVAELQDLLIKKGYKVKITAKYDDATEEAVKEYQKSKGIKVTGEVGALTLFYLNEK